MGLDFKFFLNRQGIQGKRGLRGEQGFSPVITVKTQTANEYVLNVQNEDGSFDTPNLRGNAIENNGGNYIRYNPETGEMYTGYADYASYSQFGEVQFATYAQLVAGGAEELGVTSKDVYDFVIAQSRQSGLSFNDLVDTLVEGRNIDLSVDSLNETITIGTTDRVLAKNVNNEINVSDGNNPILFTTDTSKTLEESQLVVTDNTNSELILGANQYQAGIIGLGGLTLGKSYYDSGTNSYINSAIHIPASGTNAFILSTSEYTNSLTDSDIEPIFTADTLLQGTGITITQNNTGFAKTYTISANVDLSNCVDLTSTQSIGGYKTFSNDVKFSNDAVFAAGNSDKGIKWNNAGNSTIGKITFNSNVLTIRNYNTSNAQIFLEDDYKSTYLKDILVKNDIATSVDSSSTNDKAVGAKLFYDTIGDIETLINNINSGTGS